MCVWWGWQPEAANPTTRTQPGEPPQAERRLEELLLHKAKGDSKKHLEIYASGVSFFQLEMVCGKVHVSFEVAPLIFAADLFGIAVADPLSFTDSHRYFSHSLLPRLRS